MYILIKTVSPHFCWFVLSKQWVNKWTSDYASSLTVFVYRCQFGALNINIKKKLIATETDKSSFAQFWTPLCWLFQWASYCLHEWQMAHFAHDWALTVAAIRWCEEPNVWNEDDCSFMESFSFVLVKQTQSERNTDANTVCESQNGEKLS